MLNFWDRRFAGSFTANGSRLCPIRIPPTAGYLYSVDIRSVVRSRPREYHSSFSWCFERIEFV